MCLYIKAVLHLYLNVAKTFTSKIQSTNTSTENTGPAAEIQKLLETARGGCYKEELKAFTWCPNAPDPNLIELNGTCLEICNPRGALSIIIIIIIIIICTQVLIHEGMLGNVHGIMRTFVVRKLEYMTISHQQGVAGSFQLHYTQFKLK